MQNRYKRVTWGAGQPRVRTSIATWHQPVLWNAKPFFECRTCAHRFALGRKAKEGFVHCPECHGYAIKQTRRRVFCASLSDVFDNEVDPQWRADLFALIRATSNLDWLILTKRIGNASKMMAEAIVAMRDPIKEGAAVPWPNVWLGATVVNQEEAARDIPKLVALPARVRFLSIEPMLGPVDLIRAGVRPEWKPPVDGWPELGMNVDWVIAGGESGVQARPSHPDWYRSLRDQCAAAGVAFHFKQQGEWTWNDFPIINADAPQCVIYGDGSTSTREECDALDLRESQIRGARIMRKIGKQAAGRLLDGVQHNQFPATNPTEAA